MEAVLSVFLRKPSGKPASTNKKWVFKWNLFAHPPIILSLGVAYSTNKINSKQKLQIETEATAESTVVSQGAATMQKWDSHNFQIRGITRHDSYIKTKTRHIIRLQNYSSKSIS